jgi:hypothetical protein
MIRFPLPFSMGRVTSVDLLTYEQTIDHPILDIGGSFSNIKPEIGIWLREQFGDRCCIGFDNGGNYIEFENEQDVTMFLLRWSA